MTIEEMNARKREAEMAIECILSEFEYDTGLAVESVDIDFKVAEAGGVVINNVSLGILI